MSRRKQMHNGSVTTVHGADDDRRRRDVDGLLTYDQIPSWQQDNSYILAYYRPVTGSFKRCLQSTFAIHNETVNIHSHLIGSILFFSLPAWTYMSVFTEYDSTTYLDMIVFSTFYFGVAVCFFLSSTFHIINNHSRKLAAFGNQLDYLGIVLLMWGATIPTVYYGYWDHVTLRDAYWSVVSVLGGLCCIATLHPRFRTPTFRPYRSIMYASLGLSAIVFIVHAISMRGFAEANRRMSIDWMGLMAVLNLTGALTYGTRLPEKLRPGKFDLWGSSHQILHCMVILAGLAHMFGLLRAYRYHHKVLMA